MVYGRGNTQTRVTRDLRQGLGVKNSLSGTGMEEIEWGEEVRVIQPWISSIYCLRN